MTSPGGTGMEEGGLGQLAGGFSPLLGSAADLSPIVMSFPAWIQIGGPVLGAVILGALVWLRSNRGDGTRRARGVPSPIQAGVLLLLIGAAAAAIVEGHSLSTLALHGGEPPPRAAAEAALAGSEPAAGPPLGRYPAALPVHPHATAPGAAVGAGSRRQRPFLHSQHEVVACSTCHGVGEEHRVTLIRTPRDCAACHHDPGIAYTCNDCHSAADMPPPGPVPATLDLTVWDEPRVRDLPFDHDVHMERVCQDCHTAPVTLAVELECASCHDEHHVPEAECTSCHLPADDAHGVEVHLTCSEAGCHSGDRGERPALSRTFCLMCHDDQRDHEPGGDCATCHMIPADPVQVSGFWKWLPRRGGGS